MLVLCAYIALYMYVFKSLGSDMIILKKIVRWSSLHYAVGGDQGGFCALFVPARFQAKRNLAVISYFHVLWCGLQHEYSREARPRLRSGGGNPEMLFYVYLKHAMCCGGKG